MSSRMVKMAEWLRNCKLKVAISFSEPAWGKQLKCIFPSLPYAYEFTILSEMSLIALPPSQLFSLGWHTGLHGKLITSAGMVPKRPFQTGPKFIPDHLFIIGLMPTPTWQLILVQEDGQNCRNFKRPSYSKPKSKAEVSNNIFFSILSNCFVILQPAAA